MHIREDQWDVISSCQVVAFYACPRGHINGMIGLDACTSEQADQQLREEVDRTIREQKQSQQCRECGAERETWTITVSNYGDIEGEQTDE